MKLVKNIAEIEDNAISFLDTIYGGRPDAAAAVQLVKSGKVFLPFQFEGVTAFVPPQDYDYLRDAGVQRIYGPGSNVVECAADVLRLLGHNMPPVGE